MMRSGFGVRILAGSLDCLLGFLFGLLLSGGPGGFFAGRAVVMLRIGAPGTLWKGPLPMVLGILGNFVYVLPLAMLLVFTVEPVLGSTGGKFLLGLRIGGEGGMPVTSRQLWGRTLLKTSGFSLMIMALLLGSWPLAAISLAVGLVFFLGFFAALASSGQAFHDRLAHTAVFRRLKS